MAATQASTLPSKQRAGRITQEIAHKKVRKAPARSTHRAQDTQRYQRHVLDDFFGSQPSSTEDLPPPEPFINNLTHCVIEILSGVRNLNQISRWVDENVFSLLTKRVILAERARRAKNLSPTHPKFRIGTIMTCSPQDGVIEASVLVHGTGRTRAVALRIEGRDQRWRATAVHVL